MADPPLILFLTGPSGSGKSTIARAWASSRVATTACVDVDRVRTFIRSNRARPEVLWNEEAERQWALACRLGADMAATYVAHEVSCVLDVYAPPGPSDLWGELLTDVPTVRVHLFPTFDACKQRNNARNHGTVIADAALQRNYSDFAWCLERTRPDHVIDSTHMTPGETLEVVDRVVSDAQ